MMQWRWCCVELAVLLFQVCLGAEAEDKFHMVEVEGLTYDGKTTKVPLVVLKPSVLPSVSECRTRQHFVKYYRVYEMVYKQRSPY